MARINLDVMRWKGVTGIGGGITGRIGGCLDLFTAQVNPIDGRAGGPPTLPPIGPSCA